MFRSRSNRRHWQRRWRVWRGESAGAYSGEDAVSRQASNGMTTSKLTRRIKHPQDPTADDPMPRREWLVTNGLGGYASGTVAGVVTRRYHGLLIAALPAPLGRTMMFNHLIELLSLPGGQTVQLCGEECWPNETP